MYFFKKRRNIPTACRHGTPASADIVGRRNAFLAMHATPLWPWALLLTQVSSLHGMRLLERCVEGTVAAGYAGAARSGAATALLTWVPG